MLDLDVEGLYKFHTTALAEKMIQVLKEKNKCYLEGPGVVFGYCVPYFSGLYRGTMHLQGNGDFIAYPTALPFPENSLRNILILHSFFDMRDLDQIFFELSRVLEEYGHVSIVVPYRTNWGIWASLRTNIPSSVWMHYALSYSFYLVYRFSCGFLDVQKEFWWRSIGCGVDVMVFRKRETRFSVTTIRDQSRWLPYPIKPAHATSKVRQGWNVSR